MDGAFGGKTTDAVTGNSIKRGTCCTCPDCSGHHAVLWGFLCVLVCTVLLRGPEYLLVPCLVAVVFKIQRHDSVPAVL